MPDLKSLLRRHWFPLVFAACLGVVLLPVLRNPVLPFHDLPGIMGLAAAFEHAHNPAAQISAYYDFDLRPYPSVLYFGWGYLAAQVGVPTELAFRLFLALFCLAGPPLFLLLLLRAFGRPLWLSLLAFPAAYHHQIWFGFLGSAASVTGLIAVVAFGKRVLDRATVGNHVALSLSLIFVATAHPFSVAFALVGVAPFLFWPAAGVTGIRAHARSIALRLSTLLPTLLFLRAWAATFFRGPADNIPLVTRIRRELRPQQPHPLADAQRFVEYLGNGYEGHADEIVPLVALATLAALVVFGAHRAAPVGGDPFGAPTGKSTGASADKAPAGGPGAPRLRRNTLAFARTVIAEVPGAPFALLLLFWVLATLLAGFVFLPSKLVWPSLWWIVRERCVAPFFFIAIAVVRGSPHGLRPWALAPAVAAAIGFAAFVTYDFETHWKGKVLDGFDEALAAIPAGKQVLAFPQNPDPHYVEGHPYLVQHYVMRKGGSAVPHLRGHPGSYWVTPKKPPQHPSWGRPEEFVWSEHAPGYDYFLLELPVEGKPPDPLRDAPTGAVRLISQKGRWRLYEKVYGR